MADGRPVDFNAVAGVAAKPLPIAKGTAFHDPAAEFLEFLATLLPWLAAAA
jgi:hypothetical protein